MGTRLRIKRGPPYTRRRLTLVLAVAGGVAVALVSQVGLPVRLRRERARAASGPNPIALENERRGTVAWKVAVPAGRKLEGFASKTSVSPGDGLVLRVSTIYPWFDVRVFRMGYYGGAGGRLVWERDRLLGARQPDPLVDTETHTVETDWSPSLTVPIGRTWTTGAYLVLLSGPEGQGSYIPFVVRESGRRAPILVQSSVATWQAYNAWGGYSLYVGRDAAGGESAARRATIVSFDRPYDKGVGASDFLGLELPFVMWLEEHGYDAGYATDIDTHEDAMLLRGRRVFVSLGHDEYWSTAMRAHVERALHSGTNLVFLGANAMYRHIRLEPSPLGPDRLEVNYRSTKDPITRTDPSEATVQWRNPPLNRPEDAVLGAMYECNPVHGNAIVYDPLPWLFRGTDLAAGDEVEGIVGPEYDRVFADRTHPRRLWVLFRTPVRCGGFESVQDTTFARFPSGAGVFDAGTSRFMCVFSGCVGAPPDPRVQRLVKNLLDVFLGREPASPEPDPRPYRVRIAPLVATEERRTPEPTPNLTGEPVATPRPPSTPPPVPTLPPPGKRPAPSRRPLPFP